MRKFTLLTLALIFALSMSAQNPKEQKKNNRTPQHSSTTIKIKTTPKSTKTVIMSENFEGGEMPTGWSEDIGAATQGWTFNDDASSTYFQIPSHTTYACINDDACNCDMSDVWLITDIIDLSSYTGAILNFEYIAPTWTDDICAVKVSTDGGTTWTTVADMYQTDDWETCEINLSTYAGESNFKFAFYYSDNVDNEDDYGFAIDDITLTEPTLNDVSVLSITPDFVLAGRSVVPEVTIENLSGLTVTPQEVTLTDNQSYNETVTTGLTINALSEKIIQFPAWTPSEGNYSLTATIALTGDPELSNNTLSEPCEVGVLTYPHDAYVVHTYEAKFGHVDLSTGAFTEIADVTDLNNKFPVASEYNGYAIYRAYFDGTFGIVNPTDGQCINLRSIENLDSDIEPTGLAWDWDNEIMYISLIDDDGNTHFGRIDTETYEYTEISTKNSCKIIAIDMANDGFIYGPTVDSDKLYKIDPNSGSFSSVGSITLDLVYGQDVSCDPATGIFYSFVTHYPSEQTFGTYNLASGKLTSISNSPSQMATFVITKKASSGINNQNLTNITLSPNPTHDQLTIKATGSFNLEIIDISGQIVRKTKITNTSTINISDLKQGLYLIRLSNSNNTSTFKIVKE